MFVLSGVILPENSRRNYMPNPLWVSIVAATAQQLTKKCPHCGKQGVYPAKQAGQFYTCKFCGHRFKEKGAVK
jgi:hypothetical protein